MSWNKLTLNCLSAARVQLVFNILKNKQNFFKFTINRLGTSVLRPLIYSYKRITQSSGCLIGLAILQQNASASQAGHSTASLRLFFAEIDRLHTTGSEAEGYKRLKAALESGDPACRCAELYWRLARGARAMANSCGSEGGEQAIKRKAHTYEAYDWAKKGLAADPDNGSCHKWMGIMIGLIGNYEGTTKRIENSYLMRDHLRRAVEANPGDAVTLHCLGAWCFEVADLPWYQRKIAAALFATPPSSSYDEALGYLLRAEEVDPNFYSCNQLYIAKTYLRIGDKVNARKWLQRTVEYNGDTFDDRASRKEAAELLKNC